MKQSQDAAKKETTTLTEEELATLPPEKKQEITEFQDEEKQNQEKVILDAHGMDTYVLKDLRFAKEMYGIDLPKYVD